MGSLPFYTFYDFMTSEKSGFQFSARLFPRVEQMFLLSIFVFILLFIKFVICIRLLKTVYTEYLKR
jgi:hypothetical protein